MIDPEPYIKQASWKASKHLPVFMDREDLEQEARIALWLKPPVEGEDKKHTDNLTRRRAFTSMVDALRTGWGSRRHHALVVSLDAVDDEGRPLYNHEPTTLDDPESLAMVSQALRRLLAKRGSERLHECLDLMINGMSQVEASVAMGISESRISQMCKEARTLLNTCL